MSQTKGQIVIKVNVVDDVFKGIITVIMFLILMTLLSLLLRPV